MEIVLTTINSRYHHTAMGLRYLYANLAELRAKAEIIEFVIGKKTPQDIAERLLRGNPQIIGFGVYIWNTAETYGVVTLLKKIAPQVKIVLGGPEVSYEVESQPLCQLADFVIKGEADILFYKLCSDLLLGGSGDLMRVISGPLPNLLELQLPYQFYTEEDIAHRVIYVEASRGCPYKCEYCLSSLDLSVRNFNIEQFLQEMSQLLERGVRHFKFLDRTFNLSPKICAKILEFFLERIGLGLFLHFEMVPDRLPVEIREIIKKFPAKALQFEIGLQTWNPIVAANVSRRQDFDKVKDNFQFLRRETGVHTHADLIIGLPGETRQSFGKGFDLLVECQADEIQVGILKRLKGTPIIRHDQNFAMVYSDQPPFQILQNRDISFVEMQKLNRFSQFWDHYANSGNFKELMRHFQVLAKDKFNSSMFDLFWDFSEFLTLRLGQTYALSKATLSEAAEVYLQKFGEEVSALQTKNSGENLGTSKLSKASARQQRHH